MGLEHSAARLINRKFLQETDGSDLKIRKSNYEIILIENMRALEYYTKLVVCRIIGKQIEQGRIRRGIGVSLVQSLTQYLGLGLLSLEGYPTHGG